MAGVTPSAHGAVGHLVLTRRQRAASAAVRGSVRAGEGALDALRSCDAPMAVAVAVLDELCPGWEWEDEVGDVVFAFALGWRVR